MGGMDTHGKLGPKSGVTKKVAYATPLWRRVPRTIRNGMAMRRG